MKREEGGGGGGGGGGEGRRGEGEGGGILNETKWVWSRGSRNGCIRASMCSEDSQAMTVRMRTTGAADAMSFLRLTGVREGPSIGEAAEKASEDLSRMGFDGCGQGSAENRTGQTAQGTWKKAGNGMGHHTPTSAPRYVHQLRRVAHKGDEDTDHTSVIRQA
ncbi:hypothetical protein LY76DRAFT_604377 [Colletotrichum caudatum]|nr:hypothetical protein LY76DRAFT_604377 [Colletotrichum caudatum]